ncbi:MAG: hypothetical protein CSA58_04355 [Micrococcales bacterium]|nr:MAG: hypothetical protein CSB46_05730 [Micrococcales bacterium]PIE27426.1 MAG: hypothetical protein CSA58_04355 [Micrococcales bacterium]
MDDADGLVLRVNTPGGTVTGAEDRIPGRAESVAVQPGVRPITAAAVCGPTPTVLAYQGAPGRILG